MYKNLLSPIRIGNHVIKNRMIYPNASPHFLQGPETFPAEPYRAFTAGLAKNGAAIVTVAEWADPNQRNFPSMEGMPPPEEMDVTHMQSFDLTDPSVLNYLSQMTEEVHFYGSKIFINCNLTFPEGYSLSGSSQMGPFSGISKPIEKDMIPGIIDSFVKKIRFYKNLGYDGLNVRCDMVLCPAENERNDEYGGSVENRTRLLHEAFAAVKRKYGGEFLIEGVVAWEQPDGYGGSRTPGSGYYEEDTLEFCRLFEDVIDILQVRENNGCTSHPIGYNFKQGRHPTVDFCERAKKVGIKMLLEPIGGFQEPDEMDRYIAEGKCDMFGVARAFMADPEYGAKMYSGRGEDITPCLKCNKCHGVILPDPDPWTSVCSVNPKMGLQAKLHRMIEPGASPKKVAIIGGGPAGMRAALYCTERGHDVTLYEKTGSLGGQLFHGDYLPFKWPVGNYKRWLIEQLGKSPVKVVMNTCPTTDMIRSGGYDVVLAAMGAVATVPTGIEGLTEADGSLKNGYWLCLDTFGRESELGKSVIIVGGSEVGIETAMYLADAGHDVTILTRQKKIGHNASELHYITQAVVRHMPNGKAEERPAWEIYENLIPITEATTTKVSENTVYYTDADGKTQSITADSIVICGGMASQTDQAMQYAGLTEQFYTIGDCNGAGNLEVCNREAYSRAMII